VKEIGKLAMQIPPEAQLVPVVRGGLLACRDGTDKISQQPDRAAVTRRRRIGMLGPGCYFCERREKHQRARAVTCGHSCAALDAGREGRCHCA